MRISILILLSVGFAYNTIYAQLPEAEDAVLAHFYKGKSLYEQSIYSGAIKEFKTFNSHLQPIMQEHYERYRMEAAYYIAISAIKLERPEAESHIVRFVNTYKPDPFADQALVDVANYYFANRNYKQAEEYYKSVNPASISATQSAEIQFKRAYIHFSRKEYQKARGYFERVRNVKNDYFLPTNYYIALCHYNEGNYEACIPYFQKVESSRRYNRYIPSYLAQIYYQLGQMETLIAYAPEKLEDRNVQDKDKISYVLGLAYLSQDNYEKALPLLEDYAQQNRLTKEDHYQLAYAKYRTESYSEAIAGFKKVSDENNRMGQNANLYLADCFLRIGDQESARNAFANASRRAADNDIAAEARFNYGKLSAEMGYDREAVNSLSSFEENSPYYTEAQEILSDLFLNTRDYNKVIETIESISSPTLEVQKAYQQVCYFRAVQAMQDGEKRAALSYLKKSLQRPVDPYYQAVATYWKGDLLFRESEYGSSADALRSYLTLAKTVDDLPSIASPYMAEYTLGYTYLKQNNYAQAENYFASAATDIVRNKVNVKNKYIEENIYSDALLRWGDCLFKRNAYGDAVDKYDKVIRERSTGFVYALYQKAIILGLQNKPYEKIIALEDVMKSYPNSTYADDALLEIGITYTEMGKFNEAVAPLTRLVNEYSKTSDLVVDGLLRLGLLAYNLGDVNAALNHYKAIFDYNPSVQQRNEALASIEEIYVQDLGDADGYVAFVEQTQGVKVEAGRKENISFRAAEAKFENGEYGAATEAYSKYIRQFPKGAHILACYFRKAESHLALNQYGEALASYRQVIAKGPSPYFAVAIEKAALISYNYEKNFSEATDYYMQWADVATSEEDKFTAQLGGLEAAYRAERSRDVNQLAKAVIMHPNASSDHIATAQFYKGKSAFDTQQYKEAISAFNEVSKRSDNERTAEARYLIAKTYYLQNELGLAETLCNEAYKESSNYPYWVAQSLILLSDILVAKGDPFNAKAALEVVIENFTEDEDTLASAKEKLQRIKQNENE